MTNDATGDIAQGICLFDVASKRKSGRTIALHPEARSTLIEYRKTVTRRASEYVIVTERKSRTSAQAVVNMFPLVSAPWLLRLFQPQR